MRIWALSELRKEIAESRRSERTDSFVFQHIKDLLVLSSCPSVRVQGLSGSLEEHKKIYLLEFLNENGHLHDVLALEIDYELSTCRKIDRSNIDTYIKGV